MSRNVLITGGSRGVGAEAVRAFRRAGDNVVFTYHKSELEADEIRQETGAVPVRCDMKFSNSVKIAVDKALSVLGTVDVLICAASINDLSDVTDIDETRWEEVIDTNLNGVFFSIKYVLPVMISRRSGNIMALSPEWGEVEQDCGTAVAASRAGVRGLMQSLTGEVTQSGIGVKCITASDIAEIVGKSTL